MARYDVRLLHPIRHRGRDAQASLGILRARDALVRSRTDLIAHVRGAVKAFGDRIPKCSTSVFHTRAAEHLPPELAPALRPVLGTIENLTKRIKALERKIHALGQREHPETAVLKRVHGVAEVTSLAYVLTLEDPRRFKRSREVGPYLGLTPGQHQSGASDPGRRITKEGDELLRRLLVECAHHILREGSPESDLKRFGRRLLARGGAHARQRAVTAVARKLAVLLHHLWATGEVYDPNYNRKRHSAAAAAA